ncbi:MAG: glycosyltransferase family 4 protein [Elusimicrobiales bacterium]|nr:glycosyltransferase family 4 protein [Elusimicrobiales bacterium]
MRNKIFINSRFLTQKITGSQRFAIEISKQLKKLEPDRFVFLAPKNIIHSDLAKELNTKVIGFNTGHIWEQVDLPLYLKRNSTPLLLNLVNTSPLYYKNKVVTIMDMSWKHFPYAVSKKFYLWYKFLTPKIAKKSKLILSISKFSKKDLMKELNINPAKIEIIHCSISDSFKTLNYEKEKIILSVGSLQPYKNLLSLVRAFIKLKDENKLNGYKLVLIGGQNKKALGTVDFSDYFDRNDIEFTGYIPDEKLVEYYNKASLFVFPSFFEGFGIPPLEAMACGCPCVVSNAASLPEVCGDAAYYVNPYDIDDIVNGIEKVLTDDKLRDELVRKGFENIKRFSWESSAQKVIEILKTL